MLAVSSFYSQEDGQPDLTQVRVPVQSRDTDQRELCVAFSYPTWQITEKQMAEERSKVAEAVKCITAVMKTEAEMLQADLRRRAKKEGHTDYAFKAALKRGWGG